MVLAKKLVTAAAMLTTASGSSIAFSEPAVNESYHSENTATEGGLGPLYSLLHQFLDLLGDDLPLGLNATLLLGGDDIWTHWEDSRTQGWGQTLFPTCYLYMAGLLKKVT